MKQESYTTFGITCKFFKTSYRSAEIQRNSCTKQSSNNSSVLYRAEESSLQWFLHCDSERLPNTNFKPYSFSNSANKKVSKWQHITEWMITASVPTKRLLAYLLKLAYPTYSSFLLRTQYVSFSSHLRHYMYITASCMSILSSLGKADCSQHLSM